MEAKPKDTAGYVISAALVVIAANHLVSNPIVVEFVKSESFRVDTVAYGVAILAGITYILPSLWRSVTQIVVYLGGVAIISYAGFAWAIMHYGTPKQNEDIRGTVTGALEHATGWLPAWMRRNEL